MKKSKLNSEMIWKIWKISVLVIPTPKETPSFRLPPPQPPPPPPSSSPSIHVYALFFRIEKNHPGIVFC